MTQERLILEWESRSDARRLARWALWWRENRRVMCRKRRLADFDDLRAAVDDLMNDEEVAARLRATYRHILIDEF